MVSSRNPQQLDPNSDFDRAVWFQARREYSIALRLWADYLGDFPNDDAALLNYAICHLHAGDPRESVRLTDSILTRQPDWGSGRHIRAMALTQLGELDEAYREIHRAINVSNTPLIRAGLAEILFDRGDVRQALVEFARAHRMSSDEFEAARVGLGWGMALIGEGEFSAAERVLRPISQGATIDAAEATFQLGYAQFAPWLNGVRGDDIVTRARSTFQAAVDLDVESGRSWVALGLCDLALENPGAAQVEFERGLELGGEPGFVNAQLSRALYEREQYEDAIAAARRSLEHGGGDLAWDYLALAAAQVGFDTASHLIEEAYAAAADSPVVANLWGAVLAHEGSGEDAAKHWAESSDRWPDDTVILQNTLTSALARHDVQRAHVTISRLDDASPGLVDLLDANLVDAIREGDSPRVIAILDGEVPTWPAETSHSVTSFDQQLSLEDAYVALQSTRLEEQIAEYYARREGIQAEVAARPAFLDGKEIDVLLGYGTADITLIEAKLRIDREKPVSKSEVVALHRKLRVARRNLGGAVQVAGALISNASLADEDAAEFAHEHGIQLQHAHIPQNWQRHPRWRVLRIVPLLQPRDVGDPS